MPKKPRRTELIALQVLVEQRWVYERKLEHLSFREIRMRVIDSPPHGLGYDVSEGALKGLYRGYLEHMRGVEEDALEDHVHRELADLDVQYRAAARLADPIDQAATALLFAKVYGTDYPGIDECLAHFPLAVVLRDDKVVLQALTNLRSIGESRRKLLGSDAPQQLKIDTTVHDAATDELNAMLAEAGIDPEKESQR